MTPVQVNKDNAAGHIADIIYAAVCLANPPKVSSRKVGVDIKWLAELVLSRPAGTYFVDGGGVCRSYGHHADTSFLRVVWWTSRVDGTLWLGAHGGRCTARVAEGTARETETRDSTYAFECLFASEVAAGVAWAKEIDMELLLRYVPRGDVLHWANVHVFANDGACAILTSGPYAWFAAGSAPVRLPRRYADAENYKGCGWVGMLAAAREYVTKRLRREGKDNEAAVLEIEMAAAGV